MKKADSSAATAAKTNSGAYPPATVITSAARNGPAICGPVVATLSRPRSRAVFYGSGSTSVMIAWSTAM